MYEEETLNLRDLVKRSLPAELRHYLSRILEWLRHNRKSFSYAYLGDNRGLTTLHDGHLIFVDTRSVDITPHLIVGGRWESWIEECIRKLVRPGDVVIEVGSNMGYYTLIMAGLTGSSGKVFAFEANPHLLELLTDSVNVNGYGNRVVLHPQAALDRNGSVEFVFSARYLGSGYVTGEVRRTVPEEIVTTNVDAVTLDDALKDFHGKVDLIRLDAEGSEPLILKGARELLNRSPDVKIVMEWTPILMSSLCDLAVFVEELFQRGFAVWEITHQSTLLSASRDRLIAMTGDVLIGRPCDRLRTLIAD